MEPVLAAFGRFVAETAADALPAPVRDQAALILADTVGVILAGNGEPELRQLHAGAERAPGPATILGEGFRPAEAWWAIVSNGLAGTMLELDEGNRFARGHPGIHVLPAALAEAERLGRSGAALLTALVVGYDVAARLGGAAPVRPGMHMHGVHGAVGAAAAVARLRELDGGVTARALGVAAGLTLGTSWRTALGGATVRNAYAGVGGANGWLAVDLAAAGVTPLPDMLTETFGRISGTGLDADLALDGLGERYEVTRNYFKRYACCRYNHPAVEAVAALLAEAPIAAPRIASIRVATTAQGATMADRDPVGALGAKFSIPYAVAALLVLGECGVEAFREPALSDPRVRALGGRVEVVEDPALTALTPGKRPARVEIRLTDGRLLMRQVDLPSGEFDRPYPEALLREKFVGLAAPDLGAAGAATAWELCRRTGEVKSVRELTDGFRALARPRPRTDPEGRVDFSLTEEQRGYQAVVREFAEREVTPHVRDYDREERYPIEIVRKMAPLGFLGGTIPEAYGGPGIDHLTMALGIEEMSRVCIHMGSAMGRAAGLVGSGILQFGTEAQKQRYLVPLARGETFAGTAVTEPHSGTDVAAMETTAVRRGDEYVLNGAKTWISGIGLAEWYLTFATLDRAGPRGVCAFVVERGFPGFTERPIRNKLAFRPAQVGELVFEDCRVPAENLVGREGEGLKVALCAVENGRLSVACRAVGLAQACLDASVKYARQRVVLGQPIARYQLVQAKIADMVLGIESARYLTYRLAWLKAQGVRRARRESSIAKLYASEMAFRTASDAVQIHGAYGASEEYTVGRLLRDAKFLQVVEGVNDIHRVLVGEYALGLREDPR